MTTTKDILKPGRQSPPFLFTPPEITPALVRAAIMAVVIALSPLMLWAFWGFLAERAVPEPRNTIFLWADPFFGVVAMALLPQVLHRDAGAPTWAVDEEREGRALRFGIAVILCATLSGSALPAAAVAITSLSGRRRSGWMFPTIFAATFVGGYYTGGQIIPRAEWELAVGAALAITSLVLLGLYLGSRRDLLASLRREADAARRGQAALEAEARQEERTRIAREMHDAVSHRLALVALHAGALEYRDDLSPAALREAVGVIRTGVHDAQEELRATLQVLRSDAGDTRPAPTLADLAALVDEVRAAGARVDLRADLPVGAELPAGASAHLHRVVQESLTNAVKHAPGVPITVVVEGEPEAGVRVEVRNRLPGRRVDAPGSRVGLVGLKERLALVGGTFAAAPEAGSFVVRAWVPWTS